MSNMAGVFWETEDVCYSRSIWWDSVCSFVLVFCFMPFNLFVFVLCLVLPMLPVTLDYPFVVAPLVFTNVYLWTQISTLSETIKINDVLICIGPFNI
jgi:hypothetical protein